MEAQNIVVRLWGVTPFLRGNPIAGTGPIIKRGDTLSVKLANYGRTGREVFAVMFGDCLIGYLPDQLRYNMKSWTATHNIEITAFKIGEGYCRVAMRFTPLKR